MMVFLFLPLGLIYTLILLYLLIGLFTLREGHNSEQLSVSIVVAARNEEKTLGACLDALVAQDYPVDRYEVIVVDDRSSDRTAQIAASYEASYPNVILVHVGDIRSIASPKKNALHVGISTSGNPIILLTDADCTPGPQWISGMVRYFEPDVGMVAGFSPHKQAHTLLQSLLAFESFSVAVLAAGSIGMGGALACAGRNLAYRRAAFNEVEGFDRIGHIVSGDDVLLLRLIKQNTAWKIRYASDERTFVETAPASVHWDELFHQKVRHCSKGVHYPVHLIGLGLGVYAFNVLLLVTLPWSIISDLSPAIPWSALGIKAALEFLVSWKGAMLFKCTRLLKFFLIAEVLHIPYYVIFNALGTLKRFHWKE